MATKAANVVVTANVNNMKIKIIMIVPVSPSVQPKVGEIYEVEKVEEREFIRGSRRGYWIRVNKKRVKVWAEECEIVEE